MKRLAPPFTISAWLATVGLFTVFSSLPGSLASADTIALFDFDNYPDASTGEGSPALDSTTPRIYQPSSALILPTGITSVSDITFTLSESITSQNQVDTFDGSNRFRWRTNGPEITASFSVEIAPGYALENFSLSLSQAGNDAGSFAIAYDGNAMSGTLNLNTIDDFDAPESNFTSDTIASPVSGTVNFVITVNPDASPRTTRWDNIQVNGDMVSESGSTLSLSGFMIDPTTGVGEVSLKGAASTDYILVEADDLDFSNPDQSPVPLTGATVGTVLSDQVTTDTNGDATVQFDLGGAKPATFIRAEEAP